MKKLLITLVIVCLVSSIIFIGSGCKAEETQAEEVGEETQAEETPAEEVTEADIGDEDIVIGASFRVLTTEFHNAINVAAEKKAEELGIGYLSVTSGNSPEKQISQMENYISLGVDGFLQGGTIDNRAIVPGIEALNAANIPVVGVDSKPAGGKMELFISFDNVRAAEQAGEAMIKVLKEENGGVLPEKGVIVEITGDLRDTAQALRHEGFDNVVNEDLYPQFTIVQGEGKWNPDEAFQVTSDIFTKYGDDIIALYAHTDQMFSGIFSAIEQAGYDPADLVVTSMDANSAGLTYMEEGLIDALPIQDAASYGALAVEYLYKKIMGEEMPEVGDTVTVEGELWSPAMIVEDEEGVCPIMLLNSPIVPWDVPTTDPRIWGNIARGITE